MSGGDQKRLCVLATEYQAQGAIGNMDTGDWFATRVVDVDVAFGDVDVSGAIGGDTGFAALGEEAGVDEGSLVGGGEDPCFVVGLVGDVNRFAGHGGGKLKTSVEIDGLTGPVVLFTGVIVRGDRDED